MPARVFRFNHIFQYLNLARTAVNSRRDPEQAILWRRPIRFPYHTTYPAFVCKFHNAHFPAPFVSFHNLRRFKFKIGKTGIFSLIFDFETQNMHIKIKTVIKIADGEFGHQRVPFHSTYYTLKKVCLLQDGKKRVRLSAKHRVLKFRAKLFIGRTYD